MRRRGGAAWSGTHTTQEPLPHLQPSCNTPALAHRASQGKLRIGLAEQTVLVALAHAAVLEREGLGGGKGKAGSEAVAGRLEQAAQVVKMVRERWGALRWSGAAQQLLRPGDPRDATSAACRPRGAAPASPLTTPLPCC